MNPHRGTRNPVPGGARFHRDISATWPPVAVFSHPQAAHESAPPIS
jgi:hypothetical protein